ncbi:valyl-tRNA synthetase [Granulicella rosea]|uniref:Valyl-tRNA synthetase n=1 Tax=Granulicella rosea TaxID=474952 RepID=A0A239KAD3_9BACT|nr:hypothetical protein [Granulicella rosea]SNT14652.1 valyl-tRNA synthetase [Granulicella rosea]
MQTEAMVAALDAEILKLQQVRAILSEVGPSLTASAVNSAVKAAKAAKPSPAAPVKRQMSAEGKARIVAAQKKRWAAVKKAARVAAKAVKTPAKQAAKKAAKKAAPVKTAAQ